MLVVSNSTYTEWYIGIPFHAIMHLLVLISLLTIYSLYKNCTGIAMKSITDFRTKLLH